MDSNFCIDWSNILIIIFISNFINLCISDVKRMAKIKIKIDEFQKAF